MSLALAMQSAVASKPNSPIVALVASNEDSHDAAYMTKLVEATNNLSTEDALEYLDNLPVSEQRDYEETISVFRQHLNGDSGEPVSSMADEEGADLEDDHDEGEEDSADQVTLRVSVDLDQPLDDTDHDDPLLTVDEIVNAAALNDEERRAFDYGAVHGLSDAESVSGQSMAFISGDHVVINHTPHPDSPAVILPVSDAVFEEINARLDAPAAPNDRLLKTFKAPSPWAEALDDGKAQEIAAEAHAEVNEAIAAAMPTREAGISLADELAALQSTLKSKEHYTGLISREFKAHLEAIEDPSVIISMLYAQNSLMVKFIAQIAGSLDIGFSALSESASVLHWQKYMREMAVNITSKIAEIQYENKKVWAKVSAPPIPEVTVIVEAKPVGTVPPVEAYKPPKGFCLVRFDEENKPLFASANNEPPTPIMEKAMRFRDLFSAADASRILMTRADNEDFFAPMSFAKAYELMQRSMESEIDSGDEDPESEIESDEEDPVEVDEGIDGNGIVSEEIEEDLGDEDE